MSPSLLAKQEKIKALFAQCTSHDEIYSKIIELGKGLASLDAIDRTSENLVRGCQSIVYLCSTFDEGVITFRAEADALISAGLVVLLISVYSGEDPETIIKYPPDFLEELGVVASLTPSRANGLYNIHLRMKQDAVKFLCRL